MVKEIVGISASLRAIDEGGRNMHTSVSRKFSDHVRLVGGLPFVIPVADKEFVKDYVEHIDRLILTGGEDVHPQFYGQSVQTDKNDYNIERDCFELALLEEALRQDKPVMGICRGMQLLNVAFGGSLNQHIDHHWQDSPFETSHSIDSLVGSQVERLFGQSSQINSIHHQSVQRLGADFRVTAFDPRDQTIEAIEPKSSHRLIGLQWHPEFLVHSQEGNLELFEYFMKEL